MCRRRRGRLRPCRLRPEHHAEIHVNFVEFIMEGAGCLADRRERFCRLRQKIGQGGEILSAAALCSGIEGLPDEPPIR